jgi:hypothetical protein
VVGEHSASRNNALPIAQAVETVVEQGQGLGIGSQKIDIFVGQLAPAQRSDATQDKTSRPPQSSLREELDAVRSAAEAAAIEQRRALDQERERADALARELDAARVDVYLGTVQAAEAETKQGQALERERGRADGLARDIAALRAELEAARTAGPKVAPAAVGEVEKKQALEQKLKQERERADGLARQLASLQAELEALRAAGSEIGRLAEAARGEQELALGKQRSSSEALARELAAARKEAEERSTLLAAAHAEVLQVAETNRSIAAEQKLALAGERDRADALARELTSVKNELDASNRQISALNALGARRPREPAVDSSREQVAEPPSRTIGGNGRSQEQVPGEVVASTSGRLAASEPPRSQAQSTVGEAASGPDPKAAIVTERVTSANAVSRSPLDEQRLLARANALLRQADISGARPLLEHALERGSARAAFMLAETYDGRVLQSWRARGISSDPARARELYQRAQEGGIEDAKKRIETLK